MLVCFGCCYICGSCYIQLDLLVLLVGWLRAPTDPLHRLFPQSRVRPRGRLPARAASRLPQNASRQRGYQEAAAESLCHADSGLLKIRPRKGQPGQSGSRVQGEAQRERSRLPRVEFPLRHEGSEEVASYRGHCTHTQEVIFGVFLSETRRNPAEFDWTDYSVHGVHMQVFIINYHAGRCNPMGKEVVRCFR